MKKQILILGLLAFLTGCGNDNKPVISDGQRYTKTAQDNDFIITSIHQEIKNQPTKTVTFRIMLAERPWKGSLSGKSEKFDARKQVMRELAIDAAKTQCPDGHEIGIIDYSMRDNNIHDPNSMYVSNTVSGSLIGLLASGIRYGIAEAVTDDENIPVSLSLTVNCKKPSIIPASQPTEQNVITIPAIENSKNIVVDSIDKKSEPVVSVPESLKASEPISQMSPVL